MSWGVVPVLGCSNVLKSAIWWRDVLDFEFDLDDSIFRDEAGVPSYAILARAAAGVHLQRRETPVLTDAMHYDAYFYVDSDVDELFATFVAKGAEPIFAPYDEEYGLRDFGIKTPDGHRLNFGGYQSP